MELHSGINCDAEHTINPVGRSRICRAFPMPCKVNSSHHQAVVPGFPGKGMRIEAVSPCGIVEAMECFQGKARISAVQWHPERMEPDDPASAGLLEYWKTLV